MDLTLPSRARVALLVNDALGNFCVGTIVAQGLQHLVPDLELHWIGGPRTRELEERFATRHDVAGPLPSGNFDAVVNLEREGRWPAVAAQLKAPIHIGPGNDGLWADAHWVSNPRARHPQLASNFIGEILYKACRLPPLAGAPWPGGIPRYALPSDEPAMPTPAVLLSTGGSSPDKIWEGWREVVDALGVSVGLLGAAPSRQADYHCAAIDTTLVAHPLVTDLRGHLSLPEVVGAVRRASLVVTIDNGILHFAAAFDTPTVGLFRQRVLGLWAPPNPNLRPLAHPGGVPAIPVDAVIEAARTALTHAGENHRTPGVPR